MNGKVPKEGLLNFSLIYDFIARENSFRFCQLMQNPMASRLLTKTNAPLKPTHFSWTKSGLGLSSL